MLFSSIPFMYYFLPCVLILYFAVPKALKNTVLLLASVFFYAWGEPKYVILMLATVLQGYIFGLLTEKYINSKKLSRLFTIITIVFDLGALCYFKYADFFIENFNAATGLSVPLLKIALPIGISFYTFQILSYNIDVYRKQTPAQKNFISLAAYIYLFPQLIAGPIVRYSDVALQLDERKHTFEKCAVGIRRFVIGLSKKVLIANTLGQIGDAFLKSDDKSVLFFWVYSIAFSLQIYFDFSGYSDMAIGLGKILGFDFLENFNYPYISKSITEFWRRWHMSLGTWFRDYVYIPLGGNRVGKFRHFINILVVWMLTGFWHGAEWNFILWGLYFAAILLIEKFFLLKALEKTKVLSHIYVIFLMLVSFVIFNASDSLGIFEYMSGMFGFGGYPLVSAEGLYTLRNYFGVFVIAIIGATPFMKNICTKLENKKWGSITLGLLEVPVLVILTLCVTAYLADGSFNPFLYFRF